jgi:hypothetical protein
MIYLGLLGQAPVKSEFWNAPSPRIRRAIRKTFVLEYINTMAVDRTAALVFIMRYFRP